MATKHGRRALPSGYDPADFTYKGRPAKDQGDFADDVGIADMACVNQFGEANNAKHYHGGVVQHTDGSFWCYFEWGRCKPGRSWGGSVWTGASQDFQFVQCSDEAEARKMFAKQMKSKNISRLQKRKVAGVEVWAAKTDKKGKPKSGYLVQSLATREKGLPDVLKIKEGNGNGKPKTKSKKKAVVPAQHFQRQVIELAQALVGGTQSYTRALSEASGVTPTQEAIVQVRDALIPAAMVRIKSVGDDVERQIKDKGLRDISKMVFAMVPQQIPKKGISDEEAILSSNNILRVQQDLDTFESALENEDFEVAAPSSGVNPDQLLNAKLCWIDPSSKRGQWLKHAFLSMSKNRHGYMGRRDATILNMFEVSRPDRDKAFQASVTQVGNKRKGSFKLHANLQPKRADLQKESDRYGAANVVAAIHGTRAVSIGPIIQGNFRLPKSLPGALVTGANFGHGIYFATDWRKSYGYTGYGCYGTNGTIRQRGFFMFINDMIMGDAYRAPGTGRWGAPPNGKDSVFGVGGDRGHRLENDEHVIFNPHYQRIRYLIEGRL